MTNTTTDPCTEDPWSISVKTVGFTPEEVEDGGNAKSSGEPSGLSRSSSSSGSGERNFTVQVSPDDGLATLQDQIEGATGLKASQQRLIYRGRLIAQDHKSSLKDIAGLGDGQTIHLVKKRESSVDDNEEDGEATSTSARPSLRNTDNDLGGSSTGGSLLAALLGLSSLSDESNNNNNNDEEESRPWGWRPTRSTRSRSRPHYRLTAEDLELPDPGSMEPVRQGLLTLHTLLPHARRRQVLEANRQWHVGQWIDCRDTVNQWLEATIVEVCHPDDILPPLATSPAVPTRRRTNTTLANDPAVGAGDLQGRRRLLLEPCVPGDVDEEEDGYRRRNTNEGVQLLLVHYNGWPHRWDEWIRSDSERIRLFRTRTRHPTVSSTSCPTPQSTFHEAPRTNIRDGDEDDDRGALLPEIQRVFHSVQELLDEVVARGDTTTSFSSPPDAPCDDVNTNNVAPTYPSSALPWTPSPSTSDPSIPLLGVRGESSNIVEPIDHEDASPPPPNTPQYNQRQLQNLATLLDRLGRTLTDAAPHVAAMSATLPATSLDEPPPLMARDAAANFSDDEDDSEDEALPDLVRDDTHQPLGGLLSLWSRDRRRQEPESTTTATGATELPTSITTSSLEQDLDPDYNDYVSGIVNTYRGEVRSGTRGGSMSRGSSDDVAGLLGAYLTAASMGSLSPDEDTSNNNNNTTPTNEETTTMNTTAGLGRLLRDRGTGNGGGGGGIDIHIHAVVTTSGATPGGGVGGVGVGGVGVAGLLGGATGGTTTNTTLGGGPRNLFSSTRDRSSRTASSTTSILRASRQLASASLDEDDLDLFSELYSETPEPVDPNGTPPRRGGDGDESEYASAQVERSLSSRSSVPRRSSSRSSSRSWGRLFRRRRSSGSRRRDFA